MKKIFLTLLLASTLVFTGCFKDDDTTIIIENFNKSQVYLNKYINDEIFSKEIMCNIDTKLLEIFLNETQLIQDLCSVVFVNTIIIMIIASKLYKIDNFKYIERILFLVNEKYPKDIINFTIIDKINVYTELDKIHSELY